MSRSVQFAKVGSLLLSFDYGAVLFWEPKKGNRRLVLWVESAELDIVSLGPLVDRKTHKP